MNINKFEIDYSKFSDFNIDFSKVYVKSKGFVVITVINITKTGIYLQMVKLI